MKPIEIRTRDGLCPSYLYRPVTPAPWPAVLVFMDGLGIRPAMLEIGARLAREGYLALLPDLYYRAGPYAPMDPKVIFADPVARQTLREKFSALATQANIMSDTRAFLDCLGSEPDAQRGGIACTGYCMGGRMALAAAGTYPGEIIAAASYHGAGLAPRMKARIYVAGAIEDVGFTEAMKSRLDAALTRAGVDHLIETYPARHGWVFSDTPVYDAAASERHWQTLLALLAAKLRHATP